MSEEAPPEYVLDTGPLSHFAQGQWLGVLKAVLGSARVAIPDVVAAELRNGVHAAPYLDAVLDADWIDVVVLDSPEQLEAFSYFERRMVGPSGRTMGECGVLALAVTWGAVAVLDDRVAVEAAKERNVKVRRTLSLMCQSDPRGTSHSTARISDSR